MKRQIAMALLAATSILAIGSAVDLANASGGRQRSEIQDTYCLQGRSYGYPGNCQFSTYEQCLATASGTDSGCGINPMRASAYQRGGYRDRAFN